MWPVVGNIFDIKNILGGRRNNDSLIVFAASTDSINIGILCSGFISIKSIINKTIVTQTYQDISGSIIINSDPGSYIAIKGNVHTISFNGNATFIDLSKCTSLAAFNLNNCDDVTALDLSNSKSLDTLSINNCHNLTSLDLSANIDLHTLQLIQCDGLVELDLSTNTNLAAFGTDGISTIEIIKYGAGNVDVSTTIAAVIANATSTDGTLYTDSAATYYNTIADAATAKGWTIEQL